ncbi:hypothetical protein HAU32_03030 [Weissella confusa]|uniref:Uncharacterized protein n=1 Tax=Weissella fermenti TaxID=2987699 RepID=A0ABT6D2I6_9LACO|nr:MULTISPECIES: hypothetical protein [Weissella]MBJ7687953.1 hypothetical protein [Weissella confusa]MCW0926878.1 hypothetical protein [Weissella sp. LMG 11983]MDF9299311.1 hypothetical protein [Weissella sp. BK2]
MDQQRVFIQSYMSLMSKLVGLNQSQMSEKLADYRHPEVETVEFIANHRTMRTSQSWRNILI